ncbi:MAG: O-antigen ligase family protein [Nitrospirales bacterium]
MILLGFSPKLFHLQEYVFFILLAITVIACVREGKAIWTRTPYDYPLLGFLGWILLTIPFSSDPWSSLEEVQKVLAQVTVFYGICLIVRERPDGLFLHQVMFPILCGAFLCYAFSLWDFWDRGGNLWDREVRAGFPKLDGTDITWLSTNVLMVLPMLLAGLGLSNGWIRRGLWGIVFVLGALCLLFSYSRGAWLGCMAQIFFLVWILYKRRFFQIAVPGIICLVLLGGSLAYFNLHSRIFDPSTVKGRFLVWDLGISDVWEYPLTGIGYGNQVFEQRHQADFLEQRVSRVDVPDILTKPHSWYLSVAVGTGLPGLALGCWLFGKIGLTIYNRFLNEEDRELRWWQLGVLLMVGGFFIRIFFEDGFGGSHSYLFWILVGVSLMISRSRQADRLRASP